MSDSPSLPSISTHENDRIKQFFLESERVERSFSLLQEKFNSVNLSIQKTNTRLSGKLAELNFTSHYLDVILNHMSQGLIFIDLNGSILTLLNHAAATFLGLSPQTSLYRPVSDVFDDQLFGFSLSTCLASQSVPSHSTVSWKHTPVPMEVEIESIFISKEIPLSLSSTQLPVKGLLILLRDVTLVRRLQERNAHHQRLKELGELSSHLAHEIRNPLSGIKGFAHLLHHELTSQPDLQKLACSIIQGTDQLNQFVSQILNYSRPFQVHAESTEIGQLIRDVVHLLQADSQWNSSIELQLTLPSLPIIALVDKHLLKSALFNLMINACQAMPAGGQLIVKAEADLSFVYIHIYDTGLGIAPNQLDQIFIPFFTTKESGTGLGLSEVQKVIQAHHGWVEVESVLNKGTHFTLKIPLIMESHSHDN